MKVSKLIAEIRELNEGKLQILAKKRETWSTSHFVNKPSGMSQDSTPVEEEEALMEIGPLKMQKQPECWESGEEEGQVLGTPSSKLAGSIPPQKGKFRGVGEKVSAVES